MTQRSSKLISIAIWILLTVWVFWAGTVGQTWAQWLIVATTWFFFLSDVATVFSDTLQENLKTFWETTSPAPLWISCVFDACIMVVMFYNQWYLTGIVYTIALGLGIYLRMKLCDEK